MRYAFLSGTGTGFCAQEEQFLAKDFKPHYYRTRERIFKEVYWEDTRHCYPFLSPILSRLEMSCYRLNWRATVNNRPHRYNIFIKMYGDNKGSLAIFKTPCDYTLEDLGWRKLIIPVGVL